MVEVEYRQRLKNGLRHAALKGLRPDKKPRLIRRSTLSVLVDEETIVWATTEDESGSWEKQSLLKDPTTNYSTGVTRSGCKGAAWLKPFS